MRLPPSFVKSSLTTLLNQRLGIFTPPPWHNVESLEHGYNHDDDDDYDNNVATEVVTSTKCDVAVGYATSSSSPPLSPSSSSSSSSSLLMLPPEHMLRRIDDELHSFSKYVQLIAQGSMQRRKNEWAV